MSIDLNCDLGEGIGNDALIMPFISSANIACGYHAGDENTIRKTIELCLDHKVAIGAHPGFNDKSNFGRIPMQLSSEDLYRLVLAQLEIIQNLVDEKGTTLHHVKPHGALYNMATKSRAMSATLAKAVKDFNPKLIFYGLSGSSMIEEAKKIRLATCNEVFADRTYQTDASLTPRSEINALIEDVDSAIHQVLEMLEHNRVPTVNGLSIPIVAESICIHGDGRHATLFANEINSALKRKGFLIQAPIQG